MSEAAPGGLGVRLPIVEPARLDLRRFIRPGDALLWSQGAGEPLALTGALVEQGANLGGIEAFIGLTYNAHLAGLRGVRLHSYGVLHSAPPFEVDIVPCNMSALPGLLRAGRIRADVVFCQLSPADADGFHTLGVTVDYMATAVECARVVIGEINARMPTTCGSVRVHSSRLTAALHVDRPLIEVLEPPPSPSWRRLGENIAGLVGDGATLQLGIGRVAVAVAAGLRGRRGLRVHSGLVGDWLVDLAEAGALNAQDPGVICGTAVGAGRLYAFIHGNRAVEFRPVEETHLAGVTARIPRFIAVNSALEVDLTGQVNSEVAAGRYVGATGGQVDFFRGAAATLEGLAVVALPSTASGGTRSRIVASLSGPVTTSRSDVQVVVTEHGIADLRGLTLRARTEAMLAIADPRHRPQLTHAAGGVRRGF